MKVVSFIILHYLAHKDTIECVESIKKLKNDSYIINFIIIDNNSNNNSWELINKKYYDQENVYLIKNDVNLGFSKGNNVGYKFAKELNSDFIVILNSDTIIDDNHFIDGIMEQYSERKFDVLGPDLITVNDSIHQNPLNIYFNNKKLIYQFFNSCLLYFLEVTGINWARYKFRKSVIKEREKSSDIEYVQYDVPLHGACLIFSPDFLEKMSVAFYPDTFLYMEENILFYLCQHFNLKTVYYPKIKIFHKEDASTDILMKNNSRKKRIFTFKHQIASCLKFIKLVQSNYSIEEYNDYVSK